MPGKFEIYKDAKGEFRFRLKSDDGANLLASEGYKQKPSAQKGVESVKKNAADDGRFERMTAKNGKPMFNLKASNGQIVGTSQQYSDEAARDAGIAAVKSAAPGASIDDQTG